MNIEGYNHSKSGTRGCASFVWHSPLESKYIRYNTYGYGYCELWKGGRTPGYSSTSNFCVLTRGGYAPVYEYEHFPMRCTIGENIYTLPNKSILQVSLRYSILCAYPPAHHLSPARAI